MSAEWYVVQTRNSMEKTVMNQINLGVKNKRMEDQILQVYIPTIKVTTIDKKGNLKEKEENAYPGYVYIRMELTDATMQFILMIPNVYHFVGVTDGSPYPHPLQEKDIPQLQEQQEVICSAFHIGDCVVINSGSMCGYRGTIEGIDSKKHMAQLMVQTQSGRCIPVAVDISQIAQAAA